MATKTKKTESDAEIRYRITWTNRPPLADAGIKRVVYAVGRAAKNDTCASIREAHGQVLRVQSKRPGQLFWW